MELKKISGKIGSTVGKYKYAALVFIIGLALLLIPGKNTQAPVESSEQKPETIPQGIHSEALAEILQTIQGAGKVKVLLSIATGENTVYQTNFDSTSTGEECETVIITDSARSESGLIKQVNPPTYLGAIVVCQGANSPSVKLAITQAVSKITGLGADQICVLTMK